MMNRQLKHPRLKLLCDIIGILCVISVLTILALNFYTNFQSAGKFELVFHIENTPQVITITVLIVTCILADITSYFLKKQKKSMI
ncbi:hypothetical protein CD149_01515 [Staphylococcus condimenti]|uniref:Uncharacterized protein n=1 Tax=Staphylococcus condimenti TaxID=70255 RepID=A0AB37GY89_9STAP|nr:MULTISPECIES: hypothetical protein [Staphylococcus]AMY06169.1 hypothetical protein A4G25_09635 [Staphylococcus condimenti]APR60048.1 hypothetical protein BTZ13_02040 [Staphylococcus condimenti]MDK8645247.1 hypothetical protein [Staphylococcus condimenti]OFO99476.1 hypothetical protein HMPREF3007_12480 [Staphylococcus sp. HMSC065E08]PNZ63822.1 hypothetical protein CD149_01515 [Staphylococcus condimenti]